MKTYSGLVMFGMVLAFAGCATDGRPAPAKISVSGSQAIVCRAWVRASVYAEPELLGEIRISEPGDRSVTANAFRFRVLYSDDRYEGRALITNVYAASTGKLIEESLFQLDRQKDPVNQFKGGHGFTGLHYVYAPDSAAELQYVCIFG